MIELAPNNPYGLALATPVLTAAGCFGYGVEYSRMIPLERIGAIVTPATALRGLRVAALRLIETPSGLLCAGEWPVSSLSSVLGRHAHIWAGWKTPVLLNITGAAPADYAALASSIEGTEGIAGLELDLAGHEERAAAIVAATRAVTLLPLLAKLATHDQGMAGRAQAVAAAGADAVVVAAPRRALQFDPHTNERIEGRLCGPAVRPLALRLVAEVAAAVEIPVIGSGGIASAADARQFLAAGATAVQLGSVLLSDPTAAAQISDELRQ